MKNSLDILQLILLVLMSLPIVSQEIVLNEIVSSNVATLADEDGDYPDWIELYNRGSNPVFLSGYGLSDDTGDPFQWLLPDITMMPGEYQLIFASGKDRSLDVGHWETIINRGDAWRYLPGTSEPPMPTAIR